MCGRAGELAKEDSKSSAEEIAIARKLWAEAGDLGEWIVTKAEW